MLLWGVVMSASVRADDGAALPTAVRAPESRPLSRPVGQMFDFDLPAQPLAAALDRYAAASRRPALFRSELATGRTSSAVRGRYTPEVALDLLRQGTGLMADKSDTGPIDGFVLVEAKEINARLADLSPGPERIAEARSELAAMDRAMQRLPRRHQSVLVALRVEEMTREEVGIRIDLSLRCVDTVLRQALDHCAEHVDRPVKARGGALRAPLSAVAMASVVTIAPGHPERR
jgi:DNA-directed RNA polymerase specialized sigma24 family protein